MQISTGSQAQMLTKIIRTDFNRISDFIAKPLMGRTGVIKNISTSFPPKECNSICFCVHAEQNLDAPPKECLVITLPSLCDKLLQLGYSVLTSDFPKYHMALIANRLLLQPEEPRIHPSAIIGQDVRLGSNVSVGAHSYLDGEIDIGDDCNIGSNVCIRNNVKLGHKSTILNGTVIGENPYTYGFGPNHLSERFPATGGVEIKDNVEIGNNVVISRGVSNDTVIESHCRVNDLTHIGNSVVVGTRSLIMANCDISARVIIGEECWVGQSSVLIQAVRIGNKAQLGAGSIVTRNIPSGVVAFGTPAKPKSKRKFTSFT